MIKKSNFHKFIQKILLNKFIPFKKFKVIDENGKNLGIMNKSDALNLAESKNLDLFCIKNDPLDPLCKILDYGKYKYIKAKSTKKSSNGNNSRNLKEVRITANIGEHDIQIKLQNVRKFLSDKKKVKISMRLKGRELYIKDYGLDKLNFLIDNLKDISNLFQPPKLQNKTYNIVLTPIKKGKSRVNEKK